LHCTCNPQKTNKKASCRSSKQHLLFIYFISESIKNKIESDNRKKATAGKILLPKLFFFVFGDKKVIVARKCEASKKFKDFKF
jgi:hypothetical protein